MEEPKSQQVPWPDGRPIKATLGNRTLTVLATKLFKQFKSRNLASVTFLPFGLVVKSSISTRLVEANTTQFIAENTNIPVPKIYCAFKRKENTYIVMQRLKGDWLAKGWRERDDGSRARILAQLRTMLDELRGLQPPPGTGVQNIFGGPLWDERVVMSTGTFGPFPTVDLYHKWGRNHWPGMGADYDYNATEMGRACKLVLDMHQSGKIWPLKFTHGDLNFTNVLVRGEEVVGIIDWECAGWFPAYYEFTNTVVSGPGDYREQLDYASKILEPFYDEIEAEAMRLTVFQQ